MPPFLEQQQPCDEGMMSSEHSKTEASAASTPVLQLVDVDCNLWHVDLPSLLLQLPPNDDDDDDHSDDAAVRPLPVPECFRILQRDNVKDVVAMISPSSTIAEAATGIAALKQLQRITAAAAAADKNQKQIGFPNIRIRTTVGVHPYQVNDPELMQHAESVELRIAHQMEEAKRLILEDQQQQQPYVVAIGECGLDGLDCFAPIAEQLPWFRAQIALACELQLPLFVHERKAFETTMEELLPAISNNVPVIIHCFTGTVDHCRAYIERGYFMSISGYIFREEASALQQCLEDGIIPLDKLMIETDAPFLGFAGCRDLFVDKNYPAAVFSKLNARKRKNLVTTKYPNAPSALTAVLAKVLHHLNVGRAARQGGGVDDDASSSSAALLDLTQLELQTSCNPNAFFGFGLDI